VFRYHRLGFLIVLGLFVAFAALGIALTFLHHGTAPTLRSFDVTVSSSRMSPDVMDVNQGDQVVITWHGDGSVALSIVDYGQSVSISKGRTVSTTFVADKAGNHNIETGGSRTIGVLRVKQTG
jgi:cupredoxin-like protein